MTDADGSTVYFNQLGGHAAVTAVVDTFLGNVGGDARINGRFASTDLVNLGNLLVEQICDATGGYCVYSGQDMLTAHAGMCISDAEFDAMVEDLFATYDDMAIPYSETLDGSELGDTLALTLAGMRGDIVENCL